jgi:hypothetical protein
MDIRENKVVCGLAWLAQIDVGVKLIVSLAMPLASVVAAGCKHVPRVSRSSKGYECK